MAQSMLSIKQRLNTVASIRKITNAMKLIAASRLVRLQGNLRGAKHYQAGMDACLQACLASVDFAKNPATPSCMRINESERDLYIVVTSNLGLCGAYNAEIFRLLEGRLTDRDDAIFIGEHGLRHFETAIGHAYEDFLHLGDTLAFSEVNRFRHFADHLYLQERYRTVYIAYTEPVNSIVTKPVIKKLFPLIPQEDTSRIPPQIEFDSDPVSVADQIVPHWLDAELYCCLLSAAVSEQTCRRNSMDSATDSADDLMKELRLQVNKMRQQRITQEITEVVSGSSRS